MAKREYDFFVYIAASRSHQLYIGVTNSVMRRMKEHRERRDGTYTARYGIDRLVYYEQFQYVQDAIAREKRLKDWGREKKIALIESINPTWQDLSAVFGTIAGFKERQATASAEATADSSALLRNDNKEEGAE